MRPHNSHSESLVCPTVLYYHPAYVGMKYILQKVVPTITPMNTCASYIIGVVSFQRRDAVRRQGHSRRRKNDSDVSDDVHSVLLGFLLICCCCRKIGVHRRESPRADMDKARWFYPLLTQPPDKDSIASLCLMQRSA